MNTKPSVFSFESNCNVRAIMVDGNPWFVATDVCNAIGIKHAASAMRSDTQIMVGWAGVLKDAGTY